MNVGDIILIETPKGRRAVYLMEEQTDRVVVLDGKDKIHVVPRRLVVDKALDSDELVGRQLSFLS